MSSLQNVWLDVCAQLEVSGAVASRWWATISKQYAEPARRYHTLDHLKELITRLEPFRERCNREQVVKLAIFFHDIVYEPMSGTNEEDSCQTYRSFAEEAGLCPADIEAVAAFILATKSHAYAGEDWDLKLFLDLDMAVLGRDRDGYEEYARQIRAEYKHLPLETYLRERARVLTGLLTADRLFATDEVGASLEAAARANMAAELASLGRGCIMGLPEGEDVAVRGKSGGNGGNGGSSAGSDGGGSTVVHFVDGSAPGDSIAADEARIERDRRMASQHPEEAKTRWPEGDGGGSSSCRSSRRRPAEELGCGIGTAAEDEELPEAAGASTATVDIGLKDADEEETHKGKRSRVWPSPPPAATPPPG